jgi:hypothetical protein
MEPLWVLGIETIKTAEEDYRVDVMKDRMEF